MSVTHADLTIERRYPYTPAQTFSAKGGRYNEFHSRFHEIAENERIVFVYDLRHDRRLVSVSLTTIEFTADGDGTRMLFTEQGAFFGGPEEAAERLWDRIMDGQVMTPMQKIVADALRPEGTEDPHGVAEARAQLDAAYALLDDRLADETTWLAGPAFTLADCAAAPALFYARVVHRWDEPGLPALTRYFATLLNRPSVARVVDEAREFRPLFPLPWPEYAD